MNPADSSSDLDSDEMEQITQQQLEDFEDDDDTTTTITTTSYETVMRTPAICFKSIDPTVPFVLANSTEVFAIADLLDLEGFGTYEKLTEQSFQCLKEFRAAQLRGFMVLRGSACLIPRMDTSKSEVELLGFFGIVKKNTEVFSRLCHVDICCNPLHIVVEADWIRDRRKKCAGLVYRDAFVISLEAVSQVAYHDCGASTECFRAWRPMSDDYTEYSGVPFDEALRYQTQGLLPRNVEFEDWTAKQTGLEIRASLERAQLETRATRRDTLAALELLRRKENAKMVECPYCHESFGAQGLFTHKRYCASRPRE